MIFEFKGVIYNLDHFNRIYVDDACVMMDRLGDNVYIQLKNERQARKMFRAIMEKLEEENGVWHPQEPGE